jgi:hypothetical protein
VEDAPRARSGKIGRLSALLDEYGEAIEYDLLTIGIDIKGLWTGALSWRRLGVLIDHLPAESATKTAIRESLSEDKLAELGKLPKTSHGTWSRDSYLLAAIKDELSILRFVTLRIAGNEVDTPDLYERPGIKRKVAAAANPQALEYLQTLRSQHLQLVKDGA